jgi:hypothetical protein
MSAGAQTGKPATKDPQPRARPGRGPEKYANIDACLQRGCATNETDAQTATPQPTTTLARRQNNIDTATLQFTTRLGQAKPGQGRPGKTKAKQGMPGAQEILLKMASKPRNCSIQQGWDRPQKTCKQGSPSCNRKGAQARNTEEDTQTATPQPTTRLAHRQKD